LVGEIERRIAHAPFFIGGKNPEIQYPFDLQPPKFHPRITAQLALVFPDAEPLQLLLRSPADSHSPTIASNAAHGRSAGGPDLQSP
jgi:hypothetical protein